MWKRKDSSIFPAPSSAADEDDVEAQRSSLSSGKEHEVKPLSANLQRFVASLPDSWIIFSRNCERILNLRVVQTLKTAVSFLAVFIMTYEVLQ